MQKLLVSEASKWLSIVSLLYTARMETLLASYDLTFGQFSILNHICRPDLRNGTSVTEIATVVALKQPAVTKAMAKFELLSFVQTEVNPQDQRAKTVKVTKTGLETLIRIQASLAPDLTQVFSHFSAANLEAFVSQLKLQGIWLDKNRANFTKPEN
jgi:DNA-binding MarR family transcriptional regulator